MDASHDANRSALTHQTDILGCSNGTASRHGRPLSSVVRAGPLAGLQEPRRGAVHVLAGQAALLVLVHASVPLVGGAHGVQARGRDALLDVLRCVAAVHVLVQRVPERVGGALEPVHLVGVQA